MIANDAVDQNERMKSSVGREIGVLQHIRHPLLVGMSAAFETVDTLHTVLVLEHVGGGELFDLVGRAHACFTNEFVRRTMGELIAAIGWMHQLGLVHRDIKLENILLTRPLFVNGSSELPLRSEPMIKLTDFGLSRFIDLEGSLLSTRCGSEEYAAPELILGKAYDGRKTDVWALGVVGYGIIVGRLPFGGSSRRQMLVKIAKGSYDWPSASSEGESEGEGVKMKGEEEIKRVVEKMLVRESERRIQIDEIEGFHEFKERWNSAGVGRRPIEGSEAARFLAGEIQIEP
ncbi:kinase-like domain-containing protein [Melampsora americana]|nr:kinase-like domain-containing protein [Melampsora americana]